MPLSFPDRVSLQQLKVQSKELLIQLRSTNKLAKLADAQRMIAHQYGFTNWQALRAHLDELTEQRVCQIADLFRDFSSLECRGRSASYEYWANRIAESQELLGIAAFGRTPIPNLFFAAVHLLVLARPACNLARYYTSIDRKALSAEEGWPQFREFCMTHRDEIIRLMRAKTTQTNEVRRAAYLAAAFNVVWIMGGKKSLALLEIGTSAGLNLCVDKFCFKVAGKSYGDPSAGLTLDIEARGSIVPPLPDAAIPIGQRIGIDLRPITTDDVEGIGWLNALIWPEHEGRREELAVALRIASEVPRQLIAGDAVTILDEIMRGIASHYTLCVFQTHSFNQIPSSGREKLIANMRYIGKTRPVYFVSRHNSLTLDCFENDHQSSNILAETDPHGRWIEWLFS